MKLLDLQAKIFVFQDDKFRVARTVGVTVTLSDDALEDATVQKLAADIAKKLREFQSQQPQQDQ